MQPVPRWTRGQGLLPTIARWPGRHKHPAIVFGGGVAWWIVLFSKHCTVCGHAHANVEALSARFLFLWISGGATKAPSNHFSRPQRIATNTIQQIRCPLMLQIQWTCDTCPLGRPFCHASVQQFNLQTYEVKKKHDTMYRATFGPIMLPKRVTNNILWGQYQRNTGIECHRAGRPGGRRSYKTCG